MLKFLKSMVCLFRGHKWGPSITHTEDWYAFEDITEHGGLTMGYAQGKDSDPQNNFTRTYETMICTFCGEVHEEEK